MLKNQLISFDERRDLFIASDTASAIAMAAEHWIHSAQRAIQQRGFFAAALSGGSTPKAIYEAISRVKDLDWSRVWLFWSDERAVPPDHPESNYRMAMEHLGCLPIPPTQILRMKAETNIEQNARDYEETIRRHLGKRLFDLVMLGVGEDGHTASLFPNTSALAEEERLVAANHVTQKKTWRMTFTYPCINQSVRPVIYALGPSKKEIIPQVLEAAIQSPWPSSKIGTPQNKALWILDSESSAKIK